MKLFAVCRHRGIPVITVVNKWDRPGKDALELMDEISERTGLQPTPLTWPVGIAGDFRGVLDRADGTYRRFTRTAGGATIAPEETCRPTAAAEREGDAWQQAVEEVDAARRDRRRARPVAVPGRRHHAGAVRLRGLQLRRRRAAGRPGRPRPAAAGPAGRRRRPAGARPTRSAPSCSRCRPAWTPRTATGWPSSGSARASSSAAWWSPTPRTGRPFATKYAQHVFGRERESIDARLPRRRRRPGQRRRARRRRHASTPSEPVTFPPLTTFAPEHFAVCRGQGHRQATSSSAAASSSWTPRASSRCCARTAAATRRRCSPSSGPMQFEVAQHRMEHEFSAPIELERLPYTLALRTDEASAPAVADRPRRRGAAARPTASCSRCSATSGACGCSRRTTRT